MLPDLAVNLGGLTSIDITKPGVDKPYGIHKLESILNIPIAQMLYIGDALFPGGTTTPPAPPAPTASKSATPTKPNA